MQQLLRRVCVFLSGVLVLAVLGPSPAGAVPASCPQAAGVWTCELSDGATSITVESPGRAEFGSGPEALIDWAFDSGTIHVVHFENLFLFGGAPGSFTPLVPEVQGATVDSDAKEIAITLAQTGVFDAVVTYQLAETAEGGTLLKTLTLTAGAAGLDGRIYAYQDFDMEQTASLADSAQLTQPGTIVQRGAEEIFPRLVVTALTPPSAWEIDSLLFQGSDLIDDLTAGNAVDLANTQGLVGPGDIASAFRWDLNELDPGETLTGSVQHSVSLMPEPGAELLGWVACVVLSGVRRAQRRR